jgi:excisionase family DNA binding protein
MSLILLVVGAILFVMGRFEMGSIKTEGRHVKAAGIILMLPEGVSLALALFIGLSFGNNPDVISFLFSLLNLLVFVGMIVAVGLAYVLIAKPSNAPRLPGILGELQDEDGQPGGSGSSSRPSIDIRPFLTREEKTEDEPTTETGTEAEAPKAETPPPAPRPARTPPRGNYPAVMGLREAANYLQTTDERVMALIEAGKLPAARINYRYQIARSQLDDLLQSGDMAAE